MESLQEAIVYLFVGIAVFLIGMKFMSSGLKKCAGTGIKNLFKKIADNRILGVCIGTIVTVLIQSSDATSAIVIGFINADVMTLFQGISIIMGGYLGTTVTGLLVSLSSLNISLYLMLTVFVGVIMMLFLKKKILNDIGEILSGLGILFFGLETLKEAFEYEAITLVISKIFTKIKFPPLLLIIGIVVTALVQSSSATTSIVIIMVGSRAISFDNGLYLALGATIGTVVTTLLASIGTSNKAKKTAFIAFMYRLISGIIVMILVWCLEVLITDFFTKNFKTNELALAVFIIFHNILSLIIFLPILKWFISLFDNCFKEDEKIDKKNILYINDSLLKTPTVAMIQVKLEIKHMAELSKKNLDLGINMITTTDITVFDDVKKRENSIDFLTNEISKFLVSLSAVVDVNDNKTITGFFSIINSIERIGDHADNFADQTKQMKEQGLHLSDNAKDELKQMYDVICKMYDMVLIMFDENKINEIEVKSLKELEMKTDDLKIKINSAHYVRVKEQKCEIEISQYFISFVGALEIIGDHLANIGYSFLNPQLKVQIK
jgi:phosphate:Na+ symporter